jgi:hypothetical protein
MRLKLGGKKWDGGGIATCMKCPGVAPQSRRRDKGFRDTARRSRPERSTSCIYSYLILPYLLLLTNLPGYYSTNVRWFSGRIGE